MPWINDIKRNKAGRIRGKDKCFPQFPHCNLRQILDSPYRMILLVLFAENGPNELWKHFPHRYVDL